MKINTNKILTRASIFIVPAITFLIGYSMGFAPNKNISPANAQSHRYERCYALRTPSIGYDEFNKGEHTLEDSVVIPRGWAPVGFAVSKRTSLGSALTLVCGPDK